ncbi:hypothetical protein GCM10012275_53300 [Longimycelium tulufanense]|uniref:Uncharacterized protein n=1 Tax=Longimycelium tulufanense TaxID=907463 RepID=A0A8J3CCZ5_9PSEU|nr:Imm1 family immunity protein [Longimycelium tulufanense]GGM75889.1 hypothetical protein GCM10012275_53300 [Longimycelium tulufanense]
MGPFYTAFGRDAGAGVLYRATTALITRGTDGNREPSTLRFDCESGTLFRRDALLPLPVFRQALVYYALTGEPDPGVAWAELDYEADIYAPPYDNRHSPAEWARLHA